MDSSANSANFSISYSQIENRYPAEKEEKNSFTNDQSLVAGATLFYICTYIHSIRFTNNNHASPFTEVSLYLLIAVSSVRKASLGRRAEI
jgi:hypothetical protein